MIDAAAVADVLTERFGLPLHGDARRDSEGERCRLVPADVVRTQGFAIDILIGWRSVEAAFVPGNFAAALVASMRAASPQQRAAFRTFASAIRTNGAHLTFSINGVSADPSADTVWPNEWRSLALRLQRGPIVIDHKDPQQVQRLATAWGGRMLGLSLALLPIEHEGVGEAEGAVTRVEVNRYERSPLNRAACIEIHGALCKACTLDFGVQYGAIGIGMIEVHHIEPVSGIAPDTIVDPATDLVPLCPNCHAVVHRRTPPYSVDEVRGMLRPAILG
jgi:5-methylcytosine-specific restriction protein A